VGGPVKLKPCPFCGKEPALKPETESVPWESMPGFQLITKYRVCRIACTCGAGMEIRFRLSTVWPKGDEKMEVRDDYEDRVLADLAKAWNKRVPTVEPKARNKRVPTVEPKARNKRVPTVEPKARNKRVPATKLSQTRKTK
jgi:hypothetical protein